MLMDAHLPFDYKRLHLRSLMSALPATSPVKLQIREHVWQRLQAMSLAWGLPIGTLIPRLIEMGRDTQRLQQWRSMLPPWTAAFGNDPVNRSRLVAFRTSAELRLAVSVDCRHSGLKSAQVMRLRLDAAMQFLSRPPSSPESG